MEQSPRRRAHTKVGPRRVGVPALHPAKSPPRRRRSQIRPQNSFAYSSSQKASPGGEPYQPSPSGDSVPPPSCHKSGPQKRALPTPERLFLLFWFMPATHLPGGAANRTRRPHPRPSGRRWEKSPASDSSCGRTPSPCPYQSQSTAAHPPY